MNPQLDLLEPFTKTFFEFILHGFQRQFEPRTNRKTYLASQNQIEEVVRKSMSWPLLASGFASFLFICYALYLGSIRVQFTSMNRINHAP